MKLDALTATLGAFRESLDRGWSSGLEGLYEAVAAWQAAWPPPTPADLPATLARALESSRTRAFWQGQAYFPKEALIELSAFAPEVVNLAFGRLFNRELPLGRRFGGFVDYLDEVSAERTRVGSSRRQPTTHYHDDLRAPSLYCACRYPATDAYFEPEPYLASLRHLRAPGVGTFAEPDRFEKSVRVVLAFINKDAAFAKTQAARLEPSHRNALPAGAYREPSALIVSEYFRWLTSDNTPR